MTPQLLNHVKQICRTYGIKPSKSKGQNFLVNENVLEQIIAAAELTPTDTVLEVGPGLGILTEALVKRVKRLVSVELDRQLFNFLQVQFRLAHNLELVNQDILKFNPEHYNLQSTTYKLTANLPYHITSHFLKKFLTMPARPSDMTLLLQKEVGERITARPGTMSLLAVSVQLYGQPRLISLVPKKNFWPEPDVDSAIVKISHIKTPASVQSFLEDVSEKHFWQILRISFATKRKQLHNNLAAGLHLSSDEVKKVLKQANFDPSLRAQNLSLKDWVRLAKKFEIYLN